MKLNFKTNIKEMKFEKQIYFPYPKKVEIIQAKTNFFQWEKSRPSFIFSEADFI